MNGNSIPARHLFSPEIARDGSRGILERQMKKYLGVAAILTLSAGVAVAQPTPSAPNSNPKGIGADVREQAKAQRNSAEKGLGPVVSEQAKAQRTAPEPTPTPTSTATPTTTAPAGQ